MIECTENQQLSLPMLPGAGDMTRVLLKAGQEFMTEFFHNNRCCSAHHPSLASKADSKCCITGLPSDADVWMQTTSKRAGASSRRFFCK